MTDLFRHGGSEGRSKPGALPRADMTVRSFCYWDCGRLDLLGMKVAAITFREGRLSRLHPHRYFNFGQLNNNLPRVHT